MSTTNTSFEHVLHNLQERDRIIGDTKTLIDKLFSELRADDSSRLMFANVLDIITNRINSLYRNYCQTIERFNIGIIVFVSDYYSIIEQHSDQFHSKYLHIYSGHSSHYNPIIQPNPSQSKFEINELIEIFKEHCYELKTFKFHTDSSHLRRARERTWMIYQKLSKYIASENVYDLSDSLMYEFDSIVSSLNSMIQSDNGKQKKGKAH